MIIRHLRLRAITIAAAAILAASLGNAYKIGVGPSRLELTVEPGRPAEGKIVVSGEFDRAVTITAYAADWELGPDGNPIFLESAGRRPRSLVRWLRVTPARFQLGENSRVQVVQYRLDLPPGSTGTYWGIVFFQDTTPLGPNAQQPGIVTTARVSTIIYATTKYGGIREGALTGVAAEYAAGKLTMRADLSNRGNVLLRGAGRFVLRDASSRDAAEIVLDPLPVLPGGLRRLAAERSVRLKPGRYLPAAEYDLGERRLRAQGPALVVGRQ